MPFNKIILLLFATLLFKEGFSQTLNKEKLDQYINTLEANDKLMANTLVLQNGKSVYARNAGFSNIGTQTKADANTMYRIGSISKTITATLILKAVEEGKLSFSQSIKTFFPSVVNADKIKIADLLNHHSGIHNFTGGNYMTWNTKPINRHDLIDTIAKGGSDFAPGTKASYSNSNYVLLSFILEDIYHQPYGTILNNTIIEPLRLKHFMFGDKMIAQKNKAISYNFEAGWNAVPTTDISIPMGAGGILSNAEDLATVMAAIFHGKIISKQMLDSMKHQTDGYGFGLFEKNVLGKTAYTHDGAIDGFFSFFYYFPQEETMYVLLSNAENYSLDEVNNSILSVVFNKDFTLPVFTKYTVTVAALDQYKGTYTSETNPLVIEIWSKNNFLLAQPHGQRIYTMEPVDKDKFFHEKTKVALEFIPSENKMILHQGSQTIMFTRK